MFFIALSWAAVRVATAAQVGVVLAAGSIPRALLLLPGGALADRVGPKRLIVASDSVRTMIMVGVALALALGRPPVALLIVVAAAFGVVDAVFLPAVGSLPPYLVSPDQLARLQGMRAVVQRAAIVLGAPLAGWAVAQYGLATAFGLNAALFAISVAALVMTRLQPDSPTPTSRLEPGEHNAPQQRWGLYDDIVAGLRYVRRHNLLASLLLVAAGCEFGFAGPINTGLPILASAQAWGAQGVGLALGGFGMGAATAALGIAMIGRIPRAGLVSLLGIVVTGGATIAIGFVSTAPIAASFAAALGLGSGLSASLIGTLVLTTTTQNQLGRVMGVFSLASLGGVPISYSLTGVLADTAGASATFLVGGTLATLIAAVGVIWGPLRRAELPEPANREVRGIRA